MSILCLGELSLLACLETNTFVVIHKPQAAPTPSGSPWECQEGCQLWEEELDQAEEPGHRAPQMLPAYGVVFQRIKVWFGLEGSQPKPLPSAGTCSEPQMTSPAMVPRMELLPPFWAI